jgi:hypothetical protein
MGQVIHTVPVDYGDIDFSWMVGRVITEVSLLDAAPGVSASVRTRASTHSALGAFWSMAE